jgi:threonine/homoserine/homoserine lactone efflux protein
MIAYIFQGMVLGIAAATSPGPLQAFFLHQTMKNGWRKTLPAALAPLLSDGPIILLVLLVLTRTPEWLVRIIRLGGGVFLLYLAASSIIKFRRERDPHTEIGDDYQLGVIKATITNLLNPNPYIFWGIVAGPILISAWRLSKSYTAGFMLGFYVALVGGFIGMISVFATGRRLAPQLTRIFQLVSAIALAAFGVYHLYIGILN